MSLLFPAQIALLASVCEEEQFTKRNKNNLRIEIHKNTHNGTHSILNRLNNLVVLSIHVFKELHPLSGGHASRSSILDSRWQKRGIIDFFQAKSKSGSLEVIHCLVKFSKQLAKLLFSGAIAVLVNFFGKGPGITN